MSDQIYDEGGQIERTMLAWNRTMLAFAVNGALLMRVGHATGQWSVWVGSTILVVTLIGWFITSRGYRRLRFRPEQALRTARVRIHTAAWVAIGVGVADFAAILTYR